MILTFFKTLIAVAIPMLILDGLWLGYIAKSFYAKHLGHLLAPNPVWTAAVIFYVLYAVGVTYFVVTPALAGSIPWYGVVLRGMFFGFIAYGTYDLTNHATMMNWPMIVTVVDMIWGAVITGTTGFIAWLILK